MDVAERLFLTLAEIELRKGSGLADAARQAKFIMLSDMPEFMATLAEVKAAGEPKPVKAKKSKVKAEEAPEPDAENDIDIDASLEPTAE